MRTVTERKRGVMLGAKKPGKGVNLDAIRQLQDLDQQEKAKKYPSVPVHVIPRTKFDTATANGLTQAIVTWLRLNGCWATRVSSAGRYLPGAGKFIPSTTSKGTADIHAVIDGRHASIEVKIGRDKMSPAQVKTQAAIQAAGGLYFIAKDFDSFLEWYNTIKQ